jgi:hypothetical protein
MIAFSPYQSAGSERSEIPGVVDERYHEIRSLGEQQKTRGAEEKLPPHPSGISYSNSGGRLRI